MRLIEFFCGIGGVAHAAKQIEAAADAPDQEFPRGLAVDIDADCGAVYEHNFGLKVIRRSIESIDFENDPMFQSGVDKQHGIHLQHAGRFAEHTAATGADAWWLSPPCQPYCRRGRSTPQDDRRCDALLAIIGFFERSGCHLPQRIALENVPEFATSSHCKRLRRTLQQNGFAFWDGVLCPTQWGVPNRRRRYYLIASRDVARVAPPTIDDAPVHEPKWRFSVADILEPQPREDLWLDASNAAAYRSALDLIDAKDTDAVTACFASGYGKSMIRSGSYLIDGDRVRRFSPLEVARLLGFSESFSFPEHLSTRRRWKMLGNSVSIPVVASILKRLANPDGSVS